MSTKCYDLVLCHSDKLGHSTDETAGSLLCNSSFRSFQEDQGSEHGEGRAFPMCPGARPDHEAPDHEHIQYPD